MHKGGGYLKKRYFYFSLSDRAQPDYVTSEKEHPLSFSEFLNCSFKYLINIFSLLFYLLFNGLLLI